MRKAVAAALAAASIAGGSIAVAAVNPFGIAAAQDSGSTPTAPAAGTKAGSNEDEAHEAQESPEREAAEDSGQRMGGGDHHFRGGSNEDQAHEAKESPEREAQEDAGGGAQKAPTTPAPATGSSTSGASS